MFKNVLFILIFGFILLFTTSYFFFWDKAPEIVEYQSSKLDEKVIYINNLSLTVEIADEPHEQVQGLSNRDSLDYNQGMLFIFTQPEKPGFWMKDMKFSIDIIWIDENSTITQITANVSPDTFPQTFLPASPIKYVLEVNAGWSKENNIKAGSKMRF